MINALFDLLGMFYQSGDFVQAEWMARSILLAIPDDIVSLQLLGLVYYRTDRRTKALQAFTAAEEDTCDSRGPADFDHSLQASAQCLQAASGHGSALADAWYELGLILFRLRRYQQAINALQAALSARPNLRKARRAIGRIARLSGTELPSPPRNSPSLPRERGEEKIREPLAPLSQQRAGWAKR